MIALIVAYSKNKVIGKNGHIPWNIEGEKDRFKKLTTNNVVIMGRKSYEEIGRTLPNRFTIIVSESLVLDEDNCIVVTSFNKAIEYAKNNFNGKNIYISGGADIYSKSLNIVDKMYITKIDIYIEEGDAFFPKFDENKWNIKIDDNFSGKIPFVYMTYIRK